MKYRLLRHIPLAIALAIAAPSRAQDQVLAVPETLGVVYAAAGSTAPVWQTLDDEQFVIYHDSEEHTAAACAQLLQRTREAFVHTFATAGFDLPAESPALEWLLFVDRQAFDRYTRVADEVDLSWVKGYYSARTNRVALMVRDGWRPATAAQRLSQHAEPAWDLDLASITHEAAHQLAFNLGLQRRGVTYPIWLSEGLATNFEAMGEQEELGPWADNPYRLHQLRLAAESGQLWSLRQLVAVTSSPTTDALRLETLYAQSWALFRMLLDRRPLELQQFMHHLAQPRARGHNHRPVDLFVQVFGPLSQVEREHHAYLRQLLAP